MPGKEKRSFDFVAIRMVVTLMKYFYRRTNYILISEEKKAVKSDGFF